MSDHSKIAWCDATWNPTQGCTKVSAGCTHCYAERWSKRFRKSFDLRLVPKTLDLPLHWKKPRRIFVDSMSDLFHPGVPFEFIRRVFGVMSEAPQHAYLVLTKRPQRMQEYVRWAADHGVSVAAPSSVWLGVSVEDQKTTDDRVQILLDTPAAHRFVSVEPLLGPVDLCAIPLPDGDQLGIGLYSYRASAGLDWVIVGGESGPGARRCDRGWIRSIVQQCGSAETPVFVKQLGEFQLTSDPDSRIDVMNQHSDRAGRDPSEWPPDLRVQQFPEGLCPAK